MEYLQELSYKELIEKIKQTKPKVVEFNIRSYLENSDAVDLRVPAVLFFRANVGLRARLVLEYVKNISTTTSNVNQVIRILSQQKFNKVEKIVASIILLISDIVVNTMFISFAVPFAQAITTKLNPQKCFRKNLPISLAATVAAFTEEASKYVAAKGNFLWTYTTVFNIVEFSMYVKQFKDLKQSLKAIIHVAANSASKLNLSSKEREMLRGDLERLNKYVDKILKDFRKELERYDLKPKNNNNIPSDLEIAAKTPTKYIVTGRLVTVVAHYFFGLMHKLNLHVPAIVSHALWNAILSTIVGCAIRKSVLKKYF